MRQVPGAIGELAQRLRPLDRLRAAALCEWLGQPYKTQDIVRRAILSLFNSSPGGYPGNDDLGQMSAWYVFGALGIYPAVPGTGVLALGSPLFPKATLHLAG